MSVSVWQISSWNTSTAALIPKVNMCDRHSPLSMEKVVMDLEA